MSREHIISASQFDSNSIRISGFSWCPEEKEIGLASLVAKNLCVDHNSALSPADAEAKKLLRALRSLANDKASALPLRWRIRGRLIERWLLKTTINIALQTGKQLDECFEDHETLVGIAFGETTFERGNGLHWIAAEGERVGGAKGIKFESINRNSDGRLFGAGLRFHGHRMYLALPGAPKVNDALHPVNEINDQTGKFKISFVWRS